MSMSLNDLVTLKGSEKRGSQLLQFPTREPDLRESLDSKKIVLDVGEESEQLRVLDFRHAKNITTSLRRVLLGKTIERQDADDDNFLRKVSDRLERAQVAQPEVDIVFKDLKVSVRAEVVRPTLPSLVGFFFSLGKGVLRVLHLWPVKYRRLRILDKTSGRIAAGKLTLLLGAPGSGKTTLLKVLSGRDKDSGLDVQGTVLYNGHTFDEFVVERTAALINKGEDFHLPQLTVRETLDFAARCQGPAFSELEELEAKEKELNIRPDPEIKAFMTAASMKGKRSSILTDVALKYLGLEMYEDASVATLGISQKKQLTTGEMFVGRKRVILGDEISTGLDSTTAYHIVQSLQRLCKYRRLTVLLSLLQPRSATFDLFDEVMLMAEGQIVYHGPREHALEFFETLGFRPGSRKGTADFLQEMLVTKDQKQHWIGEGRWQPLSPKKIASAFKRSHIGMKNYKRLARPIRKSSKGQSALVREKFALSFARSFIACLQREATVMMRTWVAYTARSLWVLVIAFMLATMCIKPHMKVDYKTASLYLKLIFFSNVVAVQSNGPEYAVVKAGVNVFWKHKDNHFFPVRSYLLPASLLRLPYSTFNALIFTLMVYWVTNFTYDASRFFTFLGIMTLMNTATMTQFRMLGSILGGRSAVAGSVVLLFINTENFLLGGNAVPKRMVRPWWRWAIWTNQVYYSQKALSINELHAERWNIPYPFAKKPISLGRFILGGQDLDSYGLFILICAGALTGLILFYNIVMATALKLLPAPPGKKKYTILDLEDDSYIAPKHRGGSVMSASDRTDSAMSLEIPTSIATTSYQGHSMDSDRATKDDDSYESLGLPLIPIYLTFSNLSYFVDLPKGAPSVENADDADEMRPNKSEKPILRNVSGVLEPSCLTALLGTVGAGQTELLDCLSGRITAGRVAGEMRINGFPQHLQLFKRVSGYCSQADIHSAYTTVEEALQFSASLRLSPDITASSRKAYIAEVIEMVDLTKVKNAMVGKPGVSGRLNLEQGKRLTIAVELVANPSVLFMDEPTTGLDTRAAADVMQMVRSVCMTGRAICCSIHQPSINVFEAFDSIILLHTGGVTIYSGPLGHHSCHLIDYFQTIPGVVPMEKYYNAATWVLNNMTSSAVTRSGVDLGEIFSRSAAYQEMLRKIEALSHPEDGEEALSFPTKYAQPMWKQYLIILWKNQIQYWRNTDYTAVRIGYAAVLGLFFGTVLWDTGRQTDSISKVNRIIAAQYIAVAFYGHNNAATAQIVLFPEKPVFERERLSGMYSSIPYAVAQGDIEIPYLLVQAFVLSILSYWLVRYDYSAGKFFWYTCLVFAYLLSLTFYGAAAAACFNSNLISATISTFLYSAWNLLSGYVIPTPTVPGWWIWAIYLAPSHWAFYGLVAGQIGTLQNKIDSQMGKLVTVEQYLVVTYGIKHKFVGWCACILAGFAIFFRIVTIFVLCRTPKGGRLTREHKLLAWLR